MRRRPKAPSTLVLALLATLHVPSSADAASVAQQRRKPLGPAPARADAPPAAQQEILAVLERYRRATEARELPALAAVYVDFPPERQAAQRRYFENVRDLKVAIENVDIAVVGEEAVVSYTRTDDFADVRTGRPMHVSVRFTKVLRRQDGSWKITGGKRAGCGPPAWRPAVFRDLTAAEPRWFRALNAAEPCRSGASVPPRAREGALCAARPAGDRG